MSSRNREAKGGGVLKIVCIRKIMINGSSFPKHMYMYPTASMDMIFVCSILIPFVNFDTFSNSQQGNFLSEACAPD